MTDQDLTKLQHEAAFRFKTALAAELEVKPEDILTVTGTVMEGGDWDVEVTLAPRYLVLTNDQLNAMHRLALRDA